MSKKTVTIELCDHGRTYEGRLLGLIDDKQFHALVTRKVFQNKIFSCATIPLEEIRTNYVEGFNGLRMILAIRKINNDSIGGKHLFVTERLNIIGSDNNGDLGILGEDDEYYMVEENERNTY